MSRRPSPVPGFLTMAAIGAAFAFAVFVILAAVMGVNPR